MNPGASKCTPSLVRSGRRTPRPSCHDATIFQGFVGQDDLLIQATAGISGKGFVVWKPRDVGIDGEDALYEQFGHRRGKLEPLDELGDVLDNHIGGAACGKVVDADQHEDALRLSYGHLIQPFEQPVGAVAIDTAVLGSRHIEEFAPFAAAGNAIAEEDIVIHVDGQHLEQRNPAHICGISYFNERGFRVGVSRSHDCDRFNSLSFDSGGRPDRSQKQI